MSRAKGSFAGFLSAGRHRRTPGCQGLPEAVARLSEKQRAESLRGLRMPENANPPQRLRSESGKGLRLVGPCTARGRLRVILPLLRFRARKALGENPRVLLPSGAELLTFAELLRYRARHSHVSQRQLFR